MMWKSDIRMRENSNYVNLSALLIVGKCNYSVLLYAAAAAAAKSLQSCPTLCDPIDGSPPGSPVPGILQARTLEWVSISFSNAWKWKVKVKSLCRARLLATPWSAAYQATSSMGFSRQEYRSGLPSPEAIAFSGSILILKLQMRRIRLLFVHYTCALFLSYNKLTGR